MLSQTADHLFWMSRYTERAENTARMLDVSLQTSLLPQSEASVELLLSRGADAKIKNDRGLTAGDFARLAKRETLAAKLDRGGR